VTVRIELVHVAHIPCSRSDSVVVADSLFHSAELRSVGEKCVSVWVLLAANFTRTLSSIDLENGVVWSVDVGVDSQTEEMLMVVCVDSWVDLGSPTLGVLTRVHSIGVQDTSEFDFQLNGTILVEDPVHAVLVVCGSEDVRNDEFPASGDNDGVITEIGVLEQNASILLVDADGVLNRGTLSCPIDKCCAARN